MTQYFDDPTVSSRPLDIRVILRGRDVELVTDRGVFSYGALDVGTGVLLAEAAAPPRTGNLLDLGCGFGAIAVALAMESPQAQVWAVDINPRARELAEQNFHRLGLINARACPPELVPPDVRFDCIWSNPPIRIGKPALHRMLTEWLSRLQPDGAASLVVQKHLGSDSLQAWLNASGWPTERRISRRAFRVLDVRAAPVPDR